MSTILDNTPKTIQDRSAEATARLRTELGLEELNSTELKRLSAAIAEAAAEEIAHNRAFAERVRSLFIEMAPKKPAPKPSRPKKKTTLAELTDDGLTPISFGNDHKFDPYSPPDPHFLLKLYGEDQLYKALDRYELSILRKIVARVMEQYPGSKPKNKSNREDMIHYIMTQVLSGVQPTRSWAD